MYLIIQRQWVEELGLNASAGHTWNSWDASGTKLNSGKKEAIWSNFPKRWTSSAKSLRAQFGGTTTWGNLTTSRLYQQSSVEFGEKICKLKPNIKPRLILLKAPETQKRVCLLCIRELQCTMLSKENLSSDAMDTLRRSKTPYATYRDQGQCKWTSKHKFLFMISICSQQCNYSMKRLRFFCFKSFAQKRGYSNEWKTTKLHDWHKIGSQFLVQWTTQNLSLSQDCHQIPAAVCLQTSRSTDQSNYSRKLGPWSDPVTTRSDKQATVNREPANEMNKEDPTQGIPVWLQPFTVIWRTWRRMCSHIPLKEWTQIRKVRRQKWGQERTKSVHACFRQKPKEI